MTNVVQGLSRLLLLWALVLCGVTAQAQTSINTVGFDDGTAIAGYDVVAFFKQAKAVPGRADLVHGHLGAQWRFANLENLRSFQDDPDKYLPAWGGQCAWCVSENCISRKKLSGDFEIIDGKLYLFAFGSKRASGAKDDFLYGQTSRGSRLAYGQRHWPELKRQLESGTLSQAGSASYSKTPFE